MATISELLKAEIDEYAAELRRSNRLLALAQSGAVTPAMLGEYFAGVTYMINRTVPHLRLARDIASSRGAAALATYFERKIREEAGHEKWAHADLEHLGAHYGASLSREASPAIVSLAAAIEEIIRSEPHAYLAYTFFTEYFTVTLGPEWVDALEVRCGVPREGMTVQTRHIELDRKHVAEGAAEIDELVDDRHIDALRAMLERSMRHYSVFWDVICDRAA
jgi:pyrroloquinoline quinone (PQQ) biosynthesis protein C